MKNIFLILLFLTPLFNGCLDLKEPEVKGTASISHIELEYVIDLTISNPNDMDFKVTDIQIKLLRTNGEVIGSGIIIGDTVPKKDSKKLEGTLKIGDSLLEAQNDEKIIIVVDGTAKVGIFLLQKSFPLHEEREIMNPLEGKTQLDIEL